ncbi:hypothetical protein [Chondromyces apiculatus]|uniref:hypothetical protein n=1 Tax=Chondromyces apiculatus TaxID=51 RepID=UPI0012DDD4CF|nr:hypothetical protein [Chondromyces apiculatus]
MKKSALAASVTLTLALSSSAVLASVVSSSGRIVDYMKTSALLTVSGESKVAERLHIMPATIYRFVDCPDLIPDGQCRNVAVRWNLGLVQNQQAPYFQGLLKELASDGCSVEYARSDEQNRNGSFGLTSVRPSP